MQNQSFDLLLLFDRFGLDTHTGGVGGGWGYTNQQKSVDTYTAQIQVEKSLLCDSGRPKAKAKGMLECAEEK